MKIPDILSAFKKIYFFQQILIEVPKVKFHEKSLIGSRVVPCGWTKGWKDRETERKLIVAFRNLANAPKMK